MKTSLAWIALCVAIAGLSACAPQTKYIANTSVEDNSNNRAVIGAVEQYRVALERKDAAKLLILASKKYWEDAGTPEGTDDYGYTELKDVLTAKLRRASEIRYSLKYKQIRFRGERAWVDVLVDASFTVRDAEGNETRRDLRDRNQFVLEREGDEWKFLSGM